MHDQRKVKEELDEKTRRFNEEKISKFRSLYDSAFDRLRSNDTSRNVLALLDVLLEINPEQYTLFGYRRRILTTSWATDSALKTEDLERELELNTKVILKDYKVYSAFVHRKWIISQLGEDRLREVLQGEAKKCDGLLQMDERNFHAWGYRRWVTERMHALSIYSDGDELVFTEKKINKNFSNYSAWHNRALIVEKRKVESTSSCWCEFVSKELDLCIKGFYCDPNDQSCWLYAEYLATATRDCSEKAQDDAMLRDCYNMTVARITDACLELMEDAKETLAGGNDDWGMGYVLWIMTTMRSTHRQCFSEDLSSRVSATVESFGGFPGIVRILRNRDRMREGAYAALLADLAI